MNFLKKPFEFIGRHPFWTVALVGLLFLLPTLGLVLTGFTEVFRGWSVKLLGDFGRKLADWTENLLGRSLWLLSLILFLIPPLWPLALLLGLWRAVDYVAGKGSERADFTAVYQRAEEAGVGDDVFNSDN